MSAIAPTNSACSCDRNSRRDLVPVLQCSSSVMSLLRLYLLLLALCAFVVVIEALVAWPSEVVALPSDAAPSWAPLPRPKGFLPEFTREETARA